MYFQLLSGRAAVGTYLANITKTRQVLVVQQWRATVMTSPFRQMPGLGGPNKRTLEERGKACEWKHLRAPTVRLLFQDERATPVVLNFLRDTKGREDCASTPAGGGRQWEGLEEIELWPEEGKGQGICGDEGGPPKTVPFLCLFHLLLPSFVSFFGGFSGEGDRDAPLGRYGSLCCK